MSKNEKQKTANYNCPKYQQLVKLNYTSTQWEQNELHSQALTTGRMDSCSGQEYCGIKITDPESPIRYVWAECPAHCRLEDIGYL